jgi:hypothetical protein
MTEVWIDVCMYVCMYVQHDALGTASDGELLSKAPVHRGPSRDSRNRSLRLILKKWMP